MQIRRVFLLAVICAIALSGCGTVRNLASSNPEPYGGVAKDWEFFSRPWWEKKPFSPFTMYSDLGTWTLIMSFCTVELGVTVVADTLTLPITWFSEGKVEPDKRASDDLEPGVI
jgi:uncharacterized protein YceK